MAKFEFKGTTMAIFILLLVCVQISLQGDYIEVQMCAEKLIQSVVKSQASYVIKKVGM